MRVLLTGATGFIGSHVARIALDHGHEVVAIVRPGADLSRLATTSKQLDFVEGDLFAASGLRDTLAARPPDLCVHLAWFAVPGEYLHAPENLDCVLGSLDLMRVLESVGCHRVVGVGTCFEYDTTLGYLSEVSSTRPRTLYAASKYGLMLMARELLRQRGASFAWARIFYLFGPWENENRLVPHVIRRLLAGETCDLTPGGQIRDFLHVQDVAAAIWAVATSDVEGPVNVGSSEPISVADVARRIGALTGRQELLRLGALEPAPQDPPFVCANTDLLRGRTGWQPTFTLEEGLDHTIAWWRDRLGLAG